MRHNKFYQGAWNTAGFSLIEILVGVAISSVIMLMLFGAYRTTMDAVVDTSGYVEYYQNIQLATARIDRALTAAVTDRADTDVQFISDGSSLSCVTILRHPRVPGGVRKGQLPASDVVEQSYFLEKDPQSDFYMLMLREQNLYDDEPEGGGRTYPLLYNVVSLQFECSEGRDWENYWDTRNTRRFPLAIRTTLEIMSYNGEKELFSFVSVLKRQFN